MNGSGGTPKPATETVALPFALPLCAFIGLTPPDSLHGLTRTR